MTITTGSGLDIGATLATGPTRSTSASRACTPRTGIRSYARAEETEIVVCLHTGSSSWTASRSPEAPYELQLP